MNPSNKIPLLDDFDYVEKVYHLHAIHFSSSNSCYIALSTISNLIINSASWSASTLVDSTYGSHHTAEKELSKD